MSDRDRSLHQSSKSDKQRTYRGFVFSRLTARSRSDLVDAWLVSDAADEVSFCSANSMGSNEYWWQVLEDAEARESESDATVAAWR